MKAPTNSKDMGNGPQAMTIRRAERTDMPALTQLMELSLQHLFTRNYSVAEMISARTHAFALDCELIDAGTYYVAEINNKLVGSGGWSGSTSPYTSSLDDRVRSQLQPNGCEDTAVVRAVFVHPDFARRGIGRRLMKRIESSARQAGCKRLELLSTLTGEPLYRACHYALIESQMLTMPDGVSLKALRMEKTLASVQPHCNA